MLSTGATFAVFVLGGTILLFLLFTTKFFDNANESVSLADVTSFTVGIRKLNKENVMEYLSEKISAVDLPKVLESAKYVFLKPRQKEPNPLKW